MHISSTSSSSSVTVSHAALFHTKPPRILQDSWAIPLRFVQTWRCGWFLLMTPSEILFHDLHRMLSEPKIPWGSPLEGSLEGFSRIPWMDASQLCKMLSGLSRSSPKWFIPLLTVDLKSNWALIMAVSSKLLVVNQIIPCELMIMRWFSCVMFEML